LNSNLKDVLKSYSLILLSWEVVL